MIQKLIDVDELEREMYRKCIDTDEEIEKGRAKWNSGLWIRYKVFEEAITLAPRVDAEPVRHGHWLKQNNSSYSPFDGSPPNWYICSVCGRREGKAEPYCNCGTKMDEEIIE